MNFLQAKNRLYKRYGQEGLQALSLATNYAEVNFVLQKSITLVNYFRAMRFAKKLKRGMPLAYVLGKTQFYECDLVVNKNVLIPRQETELLCELVIGEINANKLANVLDLCTGSGAIALAIAKNTTAHVTASDISFKALKLAKKNAINNKANILFVKSDLFENVENKYDLIVSNPPYIKNGDKKTLDNSVKNYEPHLALFGGESGLEFYEKIANLSPQYLTANGQLWLEIGFNQASDVVNILKNNFTNIKVMKDYSGNDRMASAILKGERYDR